MLQPSKDFSVFMSINNRTWSQTRMKMQPKLEVTPAYTLIAAIITNKAQYIVRVSFDYCLCNTVFSLLVKTYSDADSASTCCNQAVIPSGSWEEHPSTNIHTLSNRFQTHPKSETIHRVLAHIFIWSESYPVFTSPDAFRDWHFVTGCFSQRHQGEHFPFFPLSFSFYDQGDLLTCPPLSCRHTWHQQWHDYS